MNEHAHREIVLGPRTWRHAQPSAWRWDISSKGNATTKVGDVRLVVTQSTFKRTEGKWAWSALTSLEDGAKWERGPGMYDTEDEAKTAALRSVGMSSAIARTPVAPDATEAAPSPATPTRRIVL